MIATDLKSKRKTHLQAILDSKASHKLIVAGPGTGKTHTFKELLKTINGNNNIALTFINNLADDLRSELAHLAESRTFHSFSKALLHKHPPPDLTRSVGIYPLLGRIIEEDWEILGQGVKLDHCTDIFQNFKEPDGEITNFFRRSSYYDTMSFDDCVYRVVRELEQDDTKIPLYDLIVVDEYQDFNALEVRLIDLLARKSQILIVGDDDQALYPFRNASPIFLRKKYHDPNYENFDLPYCNRCPQVVVESVSNIIREAQKRGYLEDRINKPFECYLPDKQEDSKRFPKLKTVRCSIHTKVYPYVAKYIRSELEKIPLDDIVEANQKKFPCVLIVGRKDIIRDISKSLDDPSYIIDKPKKQRKIPSVYEAFKFLIENEKSNLGWRIILQVQYRRILKRTITACGWNPFFDHIPSIIRDEVDDILTILILFLSGKDVGKINERVLIDYFKADLEDIKQGFAEPSETANSASADSEHKNLTIKITTFQGCKGIEANHVFVLGLNKGILPKNEYRINDLEICQLIVALTRTRKQCHLISVRSFLRKSFGKESTFLNWIASQDKEDITVDKNYF